MSNHFWYRVTLATDEQDLEDRVYLARIKIPKKVKLRSAEVLVNKRRYRWERVG